MHKAIIVTSCLAAIFGHAGEVCARSVVPSAGVIPLETAIRRLAHRHSIDVLFSATLLKDMVTGDRPDRGDFQQSLRRLLSGTGVKFKQSADGVYFLTKAASTMVVSPNADPGETAETPIIITARRRSELLAEAPLAVTAFSEQGISERGAQSLERLLAFAPGVYFTQQGALRPGRIDGNVRFRGMTVNSGNPQEQLGSVFVDGVPVSVGLQSISFEDTERVEVINGPQSAIFGRSTFGGAINIISHQPGDKLGGRLESIVTGNGNTDVSGRIEGPIVPGVLAAQLSGRTMQAEGDYRNPAMRDQRLGRERTVAIGGAVRLSLGAFRASARVHYAHDKDGPPAAWGFGVFEANCGPFGTGTRATSCGDLPPIGQARLGQNTADAASVAALVKKNGGSTEFRSGLPTRYGMDQTSWSASFHTSAPLPSANLVIETNGGYNKRRRVILADGDLSPDPIFIAAYPMRSSDTSLELRVRSSLTTKFNWSVGSAYFDQRYRETAAAVYPSYANPGNYAPVCRVAPIDCDPSTRLKPSPEGDLYVGTFPYFIGHVTTKAMFATADFKLSRVIEVSAEGRHEWDEVRDATSVGRSQNYRSWLFRSVLSAHPFEQSTIYMSAANGNLPGSFNLRVIGASDEGRRQLDALGVRDRLPQQKLLSLEAGAKLHFEGLTLQASAYLMRWRNQRIRQIFLDPATNRTFSYYDASGGSNLGGVEIQGTWTPLQWLTFDATADIAAAHYRSQRSAVALQVFGDSDVSGNALPASPKYSGSLSATIAGTTPGRSKWYARLDTFYRDRIFADELNLTTLPAVVTANVRLGIRTGHIRTELFVTNLTQSRTPRFAAEQADISAYVPAFNLTYPGYIAEAPPSRKVGLRLSVSF